MKGIIKINTVRRASRNSYSVPTLTIDNIIDSKEFEGVNGISWDILCLMEKYMDSY